jgi:phosphate starvation-inducible protein PhoH
LNDKDVVRHDLVKKIINAYDSKKWSSIHLHASQINGLQD